MNFKLIKINNMKGGDNMKNDDYMVIKIFMLVLFLCDVVSILILFGLNFYSLNFILFLTLIIIICLKT